MDPLRLAAYAAAMWRTPTRPRSGPQGRIDWAAACPGCGAEARWEQEAWAFHEVRRIDCPGCGPAVWRPRDLTPLDT